MRPVHCLLASFALLAGLAAVPVRAETFHTCGTVIASLPTVITTQGVYCLDHDLGTAITSGRAIDIQANNVTIDCNNFKIGGLSGGTSSLAAGIYADGTRQNVTVRNCGIRGFNRGIRLNGGAGHLIEDNRLDNNLFMGIYTLGENTTIRRNRIYDTGNSTPGANATYGISAGLAEIDDNIVSGVFNDGIVGSFTFGISTLGDNTQIRGNVVSRLDVGAGTGYGIYVAAASVAVRGNTVAASVSTNGTGILGNSVTDTICSDNDVFKFTTAISNCQDGGGNASN